MDELEIKGKKYISSKRASELTSYAKDYVGQLVRAGKLPATRVGRAWYVERDALVAYHARESGIEAPAISVEIKKEAPNKRTTLTPATFKALGYVPKALPGTWGQVSYSVEDIELFPRPKASRSMISEALEAINPTSEARTIPDTLGTPIRIKILEERVSQTAKKIAQKRSPRRSLVPMGALTAALGVFIFFASGLVVFSESRIANEGASAATVYSGFHYAVDAVGNSAPVQQGVSALVGFFSLLFTYFFAFFAQGWQVLVSLVHSIF